MVNGSEAVANGVEETYGSKIRKSVPAIVNWFVFQILAGTIPIMAIMALKYATKGTLSFLDSCSSGELFIGSSIGAIAAIGMWLPSRPIAELNRIHTHNKHSHLLEIFEIITVGLSVILCAISSIFYAIVQIDSIAKDAKCNLTFKLDLVSGTSLSFFIAVAVLGSFLILLREVKR